MPPSSHGPLQQQQQQQQRHQHKPSQKERDELRPHCRQDDTTWDPFVFVVVPTNQQLKAAAGPHSTLLCWSLDHNLHSTKDNQNNVVE